MRKRGLRVHLRDQSIEILAMLVQGRGEVVTREEIRERLWPDGTIVEFEHSVHSAVNRLRDALGDSPNHPHFIETLPRCGYRFLCPVDTAVAPVSSIEPQLPGEAPQPGRSGARKAARLRHWAVAALVPASIAAAGFVGWKLMPSMNASPIRSIAVLPLANLSSDPEQQYLADGLTEELIGNLARIKAWRVTSRSSTMSYRNTARPLREIARELGDQALVEGSFQRLDDKFFVKARLVDAQTDRTIWAKSYQISVNYT